MGWMPQSKDKDWLNRYKNKTPIYVVYKRPTSKPGTHTDWKWRAGKIFQANRDQKKAGVAILISDKIAFKTKAVKRDKDGHYTMIKGSIQEEDITIINIYAPNIVSGWSCSVVSDICDPVDCCPPGSSAHGILQERILVWVAISFSRGSSWLRDRTQVSCIADRRFNLWATREAQSPGKT